jgi:hypothetical protein
VGRSLDKATAEDVHRYQLHLGSNGTTIPTVYAGASALRFFFKVTPKRPDLADTVVSVLSLAACPLFSARKRSLGFSRRRRTSSTRQP